MAEDQAFCVSKRGVMNGNQFLGGTIFFVHPCRPQKIIYPHAVYEVYFFLYLNKLFCYHFGIALLSIRETRYSVKASSFLLLSALCLSGQKIRLFRPSVL